MSKPRGGVGASGAAGQPGRAGGEKKEDGQLGWQPTLLEAGMASALGDTMAPPSDRAPVVAAAPAKFPVLNWERYEFVKLLGKGGMGAVYKARDPRLNRSIALKFIHSSDDQMILRFMQEARAQARIDHPGICKVYEVGEVDGKAYIAMQFIDGPSLHQAAGQLSIAEKARVIRDAAQALHAAHELGIIHRDIKPATVTVERKSKGIAPRRGEVLANR